jgi:hypothetical protein
VKGAPVNVFDGNRIRVLDGQEFVILVWSSVNNQMKPINAKPKIVLQPRFDQVAVTVDVADKFQAHG